MENFNHEYKMNHTPVRLKNLKPVIRFRDISESKPDINHMRKEQSLEIGCKDKIDTITNSKLDRSLFEEYDKIFDKLDNMDIEYDRVKNIMKDIIPYICLILVH